MDESPHLSDEERGLYPKYRAVEIEGGHEWERYVGKSLGYQSIHDGDFISANEVMEPFFLLKFDDPFAQDALLAYARACEEKYPQLAADIRDKVAEAKVGGNLKMMMDDIDGRMEAKLIKKAEIHSVNLVAEPPHPSWKVERVDGKPIEE